MNFEKVELYGFKSFADKAEIKFGKGITGIVGPNGCGKSNVADAIRWVLGEQSAKSLRGSSMQDVIFSGTQNRKSLSYCEVSLFFDNSNKMFSLDYNEIIITRKLYRNGDSEYFINKNPARLKDIVDLLHECGIGKEGYTIIGQGKVEEIMSAKPEDRRMIFEEATGIAKFKSRKVESERRLDRTHENIVRYSDILSEIENQLGPLEKQAEKAKEFNELSEELKFHELNTYIAKVDGVATAKGKITDKIKGIDEQTALRQKELSKAQEEYDNIFKDIENADNKLKQLNDELVNKRVGIEKSSGTEKLYQERIAGFYSQIDRAKAEIKKNMDLVDECNKTSEDNQARITEVSGQLKKLNEKASDIAKRLTVLNGKIALGEELAEESQKLIIKSIETLSDFNLSKGVKNAEKQKLIEKLDELNKRLDDYSVKRNSQFDEKSKTDENINQLDKSVFETKNQIEVKEEEVRSCNEEVAKVDNKIYTLNSLISALEARDNFYRALKDNYEGYTASVKLLMNSAKGNPQVKSKIKGVVAEIMKFDKKFDIAIETALQSAVFNVITKNMDDAKFLIEYLKQNRLGRITFLPLSHVKPREQSVEVTMALRETGVLGVANELVHYDSEYENVISNLLGNTVIVDTLSNATVIANKYRFAFKMVTLDGDLFTPQGAMTGGSRKTEAPSVLSNDRKLEDNEKQLKEKRSEMEKLQASKKELEAKRDKALDDYTLLNDMYNSKRQQVSAEKEKQSGLEKMLGETCREMESISELIEEVKSSLDKTSQDFEHIEKGGRKLEEDRESAKSSASARQLEFDKLRKERDDLIEEDNSVKINITELNAEISSLNNDNLRLADSVAEAIKNNARLKESNEGAIAIIENLKKEQEKVALTKEEQEQVNKIREDIEKTDDLKTQLRQKIEQNGEKREQLNNEISELVEKRHEQDLALSKIDSDLEYMGQSILEDYQETYETAIKVKAENYDASFGEQEINRIRKKRSSLGAINATAIDDCKILRERYDEMITQKTDLEKAESDLKEAIEKIKSEMLTQFDEGFNKINENFQKIFKELFGGGRAMLELDYTEVDDKLEAGIEIIAEPPGKKLQKLSLLSGGEKALTAIAILFSILKLRPMPFCVLDEIEAALDEANVDRFARYLQKFSEETQFIVITHRKPTMELADALFGVTMQEKGVSKTVSVKLSDVANIDSENLA